MAGTIEVTDELDWAAFCENSEQLSDFLKGDFSSIADEIADAFPNNDGSVPERFVDLVARYAGEQATLYSEPAHRKWGGVDSAQRKKLEDIYETSDIDDALHQAHRALVPQRTIIVGVMPVGVRQYKLMTWEPWEVEVTPSPGATLHDISTAREVRLRWPIATIQEQTMYGSLVFTQSAAWIEGAGQRVAAYPSLQAVDGGVVNPFGRIPLFTLRSVKPRSGRFFAPVDEPLLSETIKQCLGAADIETIAHFDAWGQKVIEFSGDDSDPSMAVDRMPMGPNRVMVMKSTGATFRIVNGQPQLDQYGRVMEASLKAFAVMRDLSPNRFTKANTAQTGAARQADKEDREESRRVWKRIFRRAEKALLALIAEHTRIFSDPIQIPETVELKAIRWGALKMVADPAQEANSNKLKDESGESSPVERIARERNIGRPLAKRIAIDNRADTLEVKLKAEKRVAERNDDPPAVPDPTDPPAPQMPPPNAPPQS